ncbi:MAG: ATP-binding protein [Leptospirillia bacterium]
MSGNSGSHHDLNDAEPTFAGPTILLIFAGVVAVTMLCGMVYVFVVGTRLNAMHEPLVRVTDKIRLEMTTAHLWFEEIIAGDRTEPIEKVWDHIDQAEWLAHAMLEGGENDEGVILPLEDPELIDHVQGMLVKLRAFRNVAVQRLSALPTSGPGSGIDQAFDAIFDTFTVQAGKVEKEVDQIINAKQSAFRRTQLILIASFILLSGVMVWLFFLYSKGRKQAERERRMARLELAQTRRMETVGVLAGGIAHDFNNLLTSIGGYIELALQKISGDSALKHDLLEVQKSVDRGAQLTRQLLLFSRKQPMQLSSVDVNHNVASLGGMLGRIIGENVEVKTELDEDAWPILADTGSMDQVIMNLVINARDAMPEGGELIIRTQNTTFTEDDLHGHPGVAAGKYLCLSVEDTGIGMDDEVRERIFDPFFTTKGLAEGTGLGMSVVHGVIEQHKGWIDVDSTPGVGTTFRVYFPADDTVRAADDTDASLSIHTPVEEGRVLLVEDDDSLRKFADIALSRDGYEVVSAATVEEAMALLEQEGAHLDLVFCDVILPDGSGIELADRVRAEYPDLPLLLTSGYPEDMSDWDRIHAKHLRFIQKPYTLADLQRVVAEVVRQEDVARSGNGGNGL